MIALARRSWLLAVLGSIAVHAALTVGVRLPTPGDARKSAGTPVSVSGTLAGILGSQNAEVIEAEVPPAQATPVRPRELRPPVPTEATEVVPVPTADVASPAPDTDVARARAAPSARPVDARRELEPVAPLAASSRSISPVLPSEVSDATEAPPTEVAPRTVAPTATQRETSTPESVAPRPAPVVRDVAEPQRKPIRRRSNGTRQTAAGSNRQGAAGTSRGGQRGRTAASAGAVRRYAQRVRSRILANRPSRSGAGRVLIAFGVTARGRLRYVRVARRSGNAVLDRAALAAVRRSAPFPRPPRGATPRQLSFTIAFRFK